MSRLKLKPCPHCGGEAYTLCALNRYRAFCGNDQCNFAGAWRRTRSEAVKAWNDGIYK